jgi:NDP-sugar pyrophosphorylase family protein
MRAVILAGGEGTRLRPLTLSVPKPVTPILGRPLLRYQIDLLRRAGITEIILCIGYKPDRLRERLGQGDDLGVRLTYIVEDCPLGTGGAVRNALSELDELTVVLNGDVLSDIDLPSTIALHHERKAAATIVVTPVPDPSRFGLVEVEPSGLVHRFTEKPPPGAFTANTINAGLYVLATRTLDLIPGGCSHSIERGFFPALLERGDRVAGVVHQGYWADIGTPEQYLQVHRDLLARRFGAPIDGRQERGGWVDPGADLSPECETCGPFFVGRGCRVEARACLGVGTVLEADVVVESEAQIVDSVLWPGCRVARGARVTGAVLGPEVELEPHAEVRPGAVLGAATKVSTYSRTS